MPVPQVIRKVTDSELVAIPRPPVQLNPFQEGYLYHVHVRTLRLDLYDLPQGSAIQLCLKPGQQNMVAVVPKDARLQITDAYKTFARVKAVDIEGHSIPVRDHVSHQIDDASNHNGAFKFRSFDTVLPDFFFPKAYAVCRHYTLEALKSRVDQVYGSGKSNWKDDIRALNTKEGAKDRFKCYYETSKEVNDLATYADDSVYVTDHEQTGAMFAAMLEKGFEQLAPGENCESHSYMALRADEPNGGHALALVLKAVKNPDGTGVFKVKLFDPNVTASIFSYSTTNLDHLRRLGRNDFLPINYYMLKGTIVYPVNVDWPTVQNKHTGKPYQDIYRLFESPDPRIKPTIERVGFVRKGHSVPITPTN